MIILVLAAFIGIPLIEIAVFIDVGDRIGLGWTLFLVVATAIAGTAMLRRQGLATLNKARAALDRGEAPVEPVLDAVCLLFAGALLLTPGFVTDTLGALLLIPALRRALQRRVIARLMRDRGGRGGPDQGRGGGAVIIDADFSELDDEPLDHGSRPTLPGREDRRR